MAKSGLKTVTRLRKYLNGVPTNETKANVEGDEDYIAPYLSVESCPIKAEDTTTTTTTTTSTTTTTTNAQGKTPVCMDPVAKVGVSDGVLLFGKKSTTNSQYKVGNGTYRLEDIPMTHPIAFLNSGISTFTYNGSYEGGTKVASDGNTYVYYYGTIYITVTGSFTDIDYECYNHGYMGGQDNMTYDASCTGITTTTTTTTTLKQGSIKTFKANNTIHASNTTDFDYNTIKYLCNQPNTGIYEGNFALAGFQGVGTYPQAGDYAVSSQYGYLKQGYMQGNNKAYILVKIHDQDKLLLIRNEDGRVIKVKQCESNASSSATQSVYLSRGQKKLRDFCGTRWTIGLQHLSEPVGTPSHLLDKTLFKDGKSIDGRGLYYIVSLNNPGEYDGLSRFEWVYVGSNGVVSSVGSTKTCTNNDLGEQENVF